VSAVLLAGLGAVALALAALAALALFTAHTARRVEAALPPDGHFVDVDGARIHYVDRGAGPTLLLIHGLGGHARNFTYALVDRLAEEFRVVVMERPGSGHSTRPRGAAAGPRAQAHAVAGFVRALGLGRPLLVGHSLGGAVALATALEHPEVVSGLALVAPLTHPEDEPPRAFAGLRIRSPLRRALVAWTVATPVSILRRRAALEAIFGPDPVPHDFATAGGGLLGLRPRAFVSASTDLVAIPDDMRELVERYGTLQVPVGILFGTGDRILDHRRHGEGMRARVADLRLELVEGGHMLPLTAPDRVAAFVRAVARGGRRQADVGRERCGDPPTPAAPTSA
jgi:pimeloyl-ACP methyl ester carboxylesterase